eukprot:CAMPEP_0116132292 /NCGR_PEP_ID=MMETSP0329-20121206/9468_1 /TAXON_ID=697910 /ORGANISM="Pseudo-nitzschia arenysensis, Strain B593" /LENGTH=188 /DNA_ID=CAMNT_0003626793 /DNA_START=165 /DNA_END=731 /DNA_ORIENTATION=-
MSNQERLTFQGMLGQSWFPRTIVSFLDGKDAIRFASASRDCRVVSLQPPLQLKKSSFEDWTPPDFYSSRFWQSLPALAPAHTVFLKCDWKDQGWGNRKGEMYVVANGSQETDWPSVENSVVCRSRERAGHEWSTLSLSFRPESDKYGIWYKIGGGGGHRLLVKKISVRVLSYTNEIDGLERQQNLWSS